MRGDNTLDFELLLKTGIVHEIIHAESCGEDGFILSRNAGRRMQSSPAGSRFKITRRRCFSH